MSTNFLLNIPKFLLNFPKWRLTQHRSVHKSSPNSHKPASKFNKFASISQTLDFQAQVQVQVGCRSGEGQVMVRRVRFGFPLGPCLLPFMNHIMLGQVRLGYTHAYWLPFRNHIMLGQVRLGCAHACWLPFRNHIIFCQVRLGYAHACWLPFRNHIILGQVRLGCAHACWLPFRNHIILGQIRLGYAHACWLPIRCLLASLQESHYFGLGQIMPMPAGFPVGITLIWVRFG